MLLAIALSLLVGVFLGWLLLAEKPEGFWFKNGDPEPVYIPPASELRQMAEEMSEPVNEVLTVEAAAEAVVDTWNGPGTWTEAVVKLDSAIQRLQTALDNRGLTAEEFDRDYQEERSLRLPPITGPGYRLEP